jgi:hypothetical protein
VPVSVLACQADNLEATNCEAPDDHFDTALALDLRTGPVLKKACGHWRVLFRSRA